MRRAILVSIAAILTCFFSGAQAFQTSPVTSSHHYRHNEKNLMAAADDWYIEDDGSNKYVSETSTGADNDDHQVENDIRTYFATCIPGLHEVLSCELVGLGATHVESQGISGVRFEGSPQIGLKAILWCRTAHKIMELISSSSELESDYQNEYDDDFSQGIRNSEDLYQFTKASIHTPTLLGDGKGGLLKLSVSTIYASRAPKDLSHTHFTALTVKNALVDAVRDLRDDGDRPNVDVHDADVPLVVVIRGRRVGGGRRRYWGGRRGGDTTASFDEEEEYVADVDLYRCLHSGGSLHRRGYRQVRDEEEAPIHRAAMKETLAAGLLLECGWDKLVMAARGDGKGAVLVDPMCGSGTFPTEAALIACDMAPGLLRVASWRGNEREGNINPHRYPPAVRWKDFSNVEKWDELLAKATLRAKSGMKWARSSSEFVQSNVKILCNEKDPRAVKLAQTSIQNAGVGSIVSLSEGDCVDWDLGGGGDSSVEPKDVLEGRTIFVCNPPWGLRLTEDIDQSWVSLREFLRREAGGCEAWVLSGNKNLTKILRMKKSRTVVAKTADEDLRWLQYHIFKKSEAPAEV